MDSEQLNSKAKELWDTIVRLETEKYDLEERQKRQDYDLKELKERQKQQLRHKAMKRGLDPEALTGKYPPKFECIPNTNEELTPEPMTTGKNFMKEVGQFCIRKCWKRIGRKNMMIGLNVQKQNCQSGLVKGLAKKLVTPNPLMVAMKQLKLHSKSKRMMTRKSQKRMRMKKRKRKKKRRRKKKRKKRKKNKAKPRPCVHDQPTNADHFMILFFLKFRNS